MRWLKRGLWLAAWGAWAWLGVGLHRELPRSPRPIQSLSFANDSTVVGFIGDSNQIVVLSKTPEDSGVVEVFDAASGRRLRSIEGPPPVFYLLPPSERRFMGQLFAQAQGGIDMLDLAADAEWTRISNRRATQIDLHPSKPWVLLLDRDFLSDDPARIVAIDLSTRKELFAYTAPTAVRITGMPVFLSDPDRILVTKLQPLKSNVNRRENSIDVWRLAEPPVLERTYKGFGLNCCASVSSAGRVAFLEDMFIGAVDVFDFNEDRFVYSDPPRVTRKQDGNSMDALAGFTAPQIDERGRRVIGGWDGALIDLETGRQLWNHGTYEVVRPGPARDQFTVLEGWSMRWRERFPSLDYFTSATRHMESAILLYRTPNALNVKCQNSTGTLAVAANGDVYGLPLKANYPLLLLCQTILALPLVMLWATLRWRSKRRLRMAGETS